MLVTVLQCDIASPDDVRRLIARHIGSDLYVLPEMWTTGFTVEPEGVAVPEEQARWLMLQMAAECGSAVAGSLAVNDNGVYRNRFYFARPDGDISYYDKHHLFTLGGEHKHYIPGQERTIVEYEGVRFMLLTCYDLRFPVWSRYREDYDCIIYVANWPTLRIDAWRTLLKARAIENQCYVVGSNRVSKETTTVKGKPGIRLFGGHSAIISPDGTTLCEASADRQEAICTPLDMEALTKLRHKFPALNDRDIYTLCDIRRT